MDPAGAPGPFATLAGLFTRFEPPQVPAGPDRLVALVVPDSSNLPSEGPADLAPVFAVLGATKVRLTSPATGGMRGDQLMLIQIDVRLAWAAHQLGGLGVHSRTWRQITDLGPADDADTDDMFATMLRLAHPGPPTSLYFSDEKPSMSLADALIAARAIHD